MYHTKRDNLQSTVRIPLNLNVFYLKQKLNNLVSIEFSHLGGMTQATLESHAHLIRAKFYFILVFCYIEVRFMLLSKKDKSCHIYSMRLKGIFSLI